MAISISSVVYYDNKDDTLVYEGYGNGWRSDAYRTITFLESPTGDLLTWLQSNAVKQ